MQNMGQNDARDGVSRPLANNDEEDEISIELGSLENNEVRDDEKKVYSNMLSRRQMESLTAACDALLPSLDVSGSTHDEATVSFFRTSSSMAGIPERLGGLISHRLKHPMMRRLRLVLWLLSTWIGTFIFCGTATFTSKFPYVESFSQMPLKKREEIMLSWSRSYFSNFRMLFKFLKLLTLLLFFSQVDENNENISWKAIGYPGPDPQFKSASPTSETRKKTENSSQNLNDASKEVLYGPLYKGLVYLYHPVNVITDNLRRLGFSTKVQGHTNRRPSNLLNPFMVIKCDVVVVGSGSGGGVVAGVLAKAGYKVLVLEKGSYHARSNLSLLEWPTMDEMYLSGGMKATNDVKMLILAGSTVGGGSTINWSASIKTPPHVRKEWCDRLDLELFESELYNEALDVVCKKMGVQSEVHNEGFNNAVLRKGCEELGYPVKNIPRNAPSDHYCGWCCLGCKDGRKKGTSETWLVDMVDSGNGTILPGCEAVKVLHKRKKGRDRSAASGVAFEFQHGGKKETCLVESKFTVVACGAVSTPALLRRSGLKNDNIGRNLHLHPVAMAWGYFPEKSSANVWPEEEKKSFEGGIMTAMSTVVENPKGSGYGALIQTPALHPGMFAGLIPWVSGTDLKTRMTMFPRTAHIFALARDVGSGTAFSPNSVSYQMKRIDEENLQRGLEKILWILAAAGAEVIGTHHCKGQTLNVKKSSYHEFEKFVREESSRPLRDLSTPMCSAHQMGSCRMGTDPKTSAVNQMGETWEVEGLFVADSSVFPTALGVNPMVTVQAIAYCTAQSVLNHLMRRKNRC